MRLLFLDIDGCLNTSPFGEYLYDFSPDEVKEHYSDLTYLEDRIPICKANLDALKHIIDSIPDIGIVWSTDWRFDKDDTYASRYNWRNPKLWLETLPWLKSKVIGMNPKKMSSTRLEEIHFWFAGNMYGKKNTDKEWLRDSLVSNHCVFFNEPYYDIDNYVIVDDYNTPGMSMYGKHFYYCNPQYGLTMEMANSIIEYLKSDDYNEEELDWERKDDK